MKISQLFISGVWATDVPPQLQATLKRHRFSGMFINVFRWRDFFFGFPANRAIMDTFVQPGKWRRNHSDVSWNSCWINKGDCQHDRAVCFIDSSSVIWDQTETFRAATWGLRRWRQATCYFKQWVKGDLFLLQNILPQHGELKSML